jgi:hypothetical protein
MTAGSWMNAMFLFVLLTAKLATGVIGALVIRVAMTLKLIASHAPELLTEFEISLFSHKTEASYVLISEKLKPVTNFLVQFPARLLLGLPGVNVPHDVVVVKDFELVISS